MGKGFFALPRIVILVIALFTNWFTVAYETRIWPILGFIFLPYTTLAWLGARLNCEDQFSVGWCLVVGISFLADLGAINSVRGEDVDDEE